jgi:hypothetical protein
MQHLLAWIDETDHRRAEHDAGEHLAQHRGLAHRLEEVAEELGPGEHRTDGEQESGDAGGLGEHRCEHHV